jgi:apolipoprotein N-acyltransferase
MGCAAVLYNTYIVNAKNSKKIKTKQLFFIFSTSSQLYISFLLLGISMIWDKGGWLTLVALIPAINYLAKFNELSTRKVLKDFYLAGFILCGFANLFFFELAPENWTIALTGWFGLVSRFVSWLLICSFCSLSFLLLGYILKRIKYLNHRLLALPVLFALTELVRSYLFASMAFGPHGSFSPNFNWGSIAVPASGTPLVYSSRLIGFFGITAAVVVVNIALYLLLFKRRIIVPLSLILVICTVTILGWKLGETKGSKQLRVAVVHLNERQDLSEWSKSFWPAQNTDIIVLPEYSNVQSNKNFKLILSRLSKDGIAVTTRPIGRAPNEINSVTYYNKDGNVVNTQGKTFLIPTGEYMPYSLQASFTLLGKKQALTDFHYSQKLTKGTIDEYPLRSNKDVYIGTLACSGISALTQYRQLTDKGADVLVNSASLAFLQPDSLYHIYAKNMARYHSIVNNRPFLQSSRSGQSYILDNQGQTLVQSIDQNNQIYSATITIKK